ncbi:MAG: co-chaperone HscB [Algicola sp.]|nr:co-chaperone HscB [Algicola sp.]
MNYFELFNLSFQFDVDVEAIAGTYRDLQRAVHPDKFAHQGERQKLLAVQKSAEVNDAYQTLKNPLLRALYMLAEQGVDIQLEQKTLQDPIFLMQQMEFREQLEDISQMDEGDEQDQLIASFENSIKRLTADYYCQLGTLLVSSCKVSLENAAIVVRKLKFMNKLSDELERLEETIL